MKQTPKIVRIDSKHIACYTGKTSLANNRVPGVWKTFMPLRNKIPGRFGTDLFSIQSFPPGFKMSQFTNELEYTYRAGVEVSSFGIWPEKLDPFVIPSGLYAVFIHRGTAASFYQTGLYIFGEWIPKSKYEEDNSRPHFEILDHNYLGPDNPESVEKVYIPIKKIIA